MEYAIAQAYLVKQGIDFSKISWVATRQTSNTVQALAAGQIDAAWMNTPAALPAMAMAPTLKILVDAKTIAAASPNPGGAVVVTDRFAAQNPETVQAFVDAVIEANRALYTDRTFFDRVVEKWFPGIYSEQQRTILYEAHRASWGVNGGLPLGVMEAALDNWKTNINPDKAKNAFFSKAVDLMDLRFARKSLERLGRFEGALDTAEWFDVKR
jgi:ABC-type nitrate/sulfonate/bicarbonate transport system substrate-binding protein